MAMAIVVMVMVTPTVVPILTTTTMVGGPTAQLPTGTLDRTITKALTVNNTQALLIPAKHTTLQLLESASSISSVWGTTSVTLTSMVAPSTIAGEPCTSIKIRVEMTEYPTVSSRVRDRIAPKNILARASIPTCRVSPLSYHAAQRLKTSHFILSIPADFPAPPPRTVTSK